MFDIRGIEIKRGRQDRSVTASKPLVPCGPRRFTVSEGKKQVYYTKVETRKIAKSTYSRRVRCGAERSALYRSIPPASVVVADPASNIFNMG